MLLKHYGLQMQLKFVLQNFAKSVKIMTFGLDSSYCDALDLQISMDMYRKNRPSPWEKFFNVLFPY